jgi:hypothetical protein
LNDWIAHELEEMWKEAAVAYFNTVHHLPGGTEENHDEPMSR